MIWLKNIIIAIILILGLIAAIDYLEQYEDDLGIKENITIESNSTKPIINTER